MEGSGTKPAYWGEFRLNGHVLLACALGLALGAALNHYTSNYFTPALMKAFGWSKAQMAFTGTFALINVAFVPFWGRFTDWYGPRIAAIIGFTAVPLSYLLYATMGGNLWAYYAITAFHMMFGVLTTTIVFVSVIISRFEVGRGMALSLLMSGAPLASAILTRRLAMVIAGDGHVSEFGQTWRLANEGWRAGYLLMAAISAMAGLVAILLMSRGTVISAEAKADRTPLTLAQFKAYARHPAFLLLFGGMFLVNVPQTIVSGQLNVMLSENHPPAWLLLEGMTIYAASVVIGRLLTGLVLDLVPAHLIALVILGLPAFGYFGMAMPFDPVWLLASSIAIIGLAQGAEGDLGAYIAAKRFNVQHFSLVYSFLILAMGLANWLGASVLTASLTLTQRFDAFLIVCAVATLLGTLAFFLTGRAAAVTDHG